MNNWTAALLALAAQASGPAPDEQEALRRAHAAVHPSFVALEITVRKRTRIEKAEIEEDPPDPEIRAAYEAAEQGLPLETWGVAIAPDLILTHDRGLRESDYARVEAVDATGTRFAARPAGIGLDHDFLLLRPSDPRPLTPLAFGPWRPPTLGERFHITFAERVDGRWHLNVSPYIQTNAPLTPGEDWFCIDPLRPGSVVSDRHGTPVGIALDQYLWVRPDGRSSFLGPGILADPRVQDLERRVEAVRQKLPSVLKRIEASFRLERTSERRGGMPDEARSGRAVFFGVTLDERGTLFVPEDLPRDLVRKIEELRVSEENRSYPATFLGSFRDFGGFLVRAEGLTSRPGAVRRAEPPPPGRLFLTAAAEDRFGHARYRLEYNRAFRIDRGLGGAPRVQPRRRVRAGSFLLDLDGRIVGCATVDKAPEDFDEAAGGGEFRERLPAEHLRRLLFFSEIDAVLAEPGPHFDPRAVPMSRREARRLVWLGVEFQEMSRELADVLGIRARELTNDGRRGLVVTDVYPGSPAARAGLRVEDVLLSVQPEGEPSPRDLVADPDRMSGPPFARFGRFPSRETSPPWRPTRNYLTSLLTEIGPDRSVAFEFLRGRTKHRIQVKLEYAPTDYESAERFRDESLGLTVKELTYEVRHFYRLDPDAGGVVVARVESGSRADVAKVPPLSVILRVNDVAVRDLAHFREIIARAPRLTLTTLSYGQTRLVELERE